jgi:hypothetical protein
VPSVRGVGHYVKETRERGLFLVKLTAQIVDAGTARSNMKAWDKLGQYILVMYAAQVLTHDGSDAV